MKPTSEFLKHVARNHAIPFSAMEKFSSIRPQSLVVSGQDIYLDGPIVDSATAKLYEQWGYDLNFVTPENVRQAIEDIGGKDITLWINSPGGSVFDAGAILTAMQRHQSGEHAVNVVVDGLAASAATYIAVHGDDRQIGKMSMFMIHNSWSYAIGDAAEMRKIADVLDKIDGTYSEMMAEQSTMSEEDIRTAMQKETWFTGGEAVEAGFMDSVYEPPKGGKKTKSSAQRAMQLARQLHYSG